MAKNKRQLDNQDPVGLDNVHASRKKRVKYTQEDASLAEIYNNLADEVESTRIKAAGDLIKSLSAASLEDSERLQTAETRLIKGLCSGRKAARLGFSIALTELFRLKFDSRTSVGIEHPSLVSTVDTIINVTKSQGNVSAQEKRDNLLGQRFSFQALLQSDVGIRKHVTDDQWTCLLRAIFKLASEKPWLRRECGAMVHEYLASPSASKLSDARIRMVIDELIGQNLAQTPEGVAVWLTVQKSFPQVKLPKHVWHHRHPLSSKELPVLAKVLLESPGDDGTAAVKNGSRQSTISFAWKLILLQLYEHDGDRFSKFWESAVASKMFSPAASAERRALGLQVLSLAIYTAPLGLLQYVVGAPQILTCILQHRSGTERHLFDATKVPLNQMVARAKQEPETAAVFFQHLAVNGRPNFDQLTKSKTVEDLVASANPKALTQMVNGITSAITVSSATDYTRIDHDRRALADLFLVVIRVHKRPSELFVQASTSPNSVQLVPWAVTILQGMVSLCSNQSKTPFQPSISDGTKAMAKGRLMSCLSLLIGDDIDHAVLAPCVVVDQLSMIGIVLDPPGFSPHDRMCIAQAVKHINDIKNSNSQDTTRLAFQLLMSLCLIQAHIEGPDSSVVLEELTHCYEAYESDDDSSNTLIELLLSFVSQQSTLYKKLVRQVFPVFAANITAEGLQSLVDILEQKENLSGQQALFDQQGEGDTKESDIASDDGIEIDVEDASDLELVNGREAPISDAEDEISSSGNSSDAQEDANAGKEEDDEAAAFDKKLAEALGTSKMDDSDDDGSEMDDDQMMELEPHLTSIFKERQTQSTNKSERKDAKENIVNFKNRVLDLLTIYVKTQYFKELALDLLLPLTVLIRTTTSKPTGEKAFEVLKHYFESSSKNKEIPAPQDYEACFQLLTALHAEMKLGGSKLHANACSRASLFLCKVLVGLDLEYYRRVADMYAKLQADWYLDEKSKVPNSVFTEWTSWSINTRKHV